jgi:2-oxoglutarate ferredoxin oxidoreductase subunit gamma
MRDRCEIRFAGTGGQGAILAGIVLADAATGDGKNVVQSQSYGPEARGGASRSEVVISDGTVNFPKVLAPNVTVCLSQEACDRYARRTLRGGLLILDTDRVTRAPTVRAVGLPLASLARQAAGREVAANIVALGVLGGLTGIVSRESLERAVRERAPRGTVEANLRALDAGYAAADQFIRQHT